MSEQPATQSAPPPASITIAQITLAATDVPRMVAFYNAVFDANLEPFEAYDNMLYRGNLAGFTFIICPNEMLGIQADKNRQQFDFFVTDVDTAVAGALDTGGGFYGEEGVSRWDGVKMASLRDPDGNSLVLREKSIAPTPSA
ncbi:VOC family protein [Chloroflexota bacterium]